jgi:CheY-like chemotaxis protein
MTSPHIKDPEARITVLHVDDEHAQRSLSKSFIEGADPTLTVVSAGTADEALTLLGAGGFECVVSDYKMPGIDGIELARRIRESSDIPYILYTGHGSEEVAERAFSVGIDDYLRKELDPSHYQVLVKRIRSTVEKHRTEVQLREALLTTASIFDKIPSGLFIYQYEPPDRLVLVDSNPESSRLTGLRIEEWRGREFSEIWPYDREVGLKERYLELVRSGGALRFENVFWDDERVTGYFRIHAFPIPGDRVAVAFENITERVSYEKRLEALHRHASQISQARTIEDVTWTTLRAIESALGFDRGASAS